jgi:RHS repeat-associated protein
MSVDAAGTPPFTYQWFRDGLEITETSQTLTIGPASIFDAGEYHVVVSNDCGEATSSTATLSVTEAPAIDTPPTGGDACQGDAHTFFVSATGSPPLKFQWFKDGASLSGETGQSLTIVPVDLADEGSYHAHVINTCGETKSAAAFLTVTEPPTITGQPAGAALCAGEGHTFSVSATGTAPLTFQWSKDGTNLPGATGQSLIITAATAADAGGYRVLVTNACGKATSGTATLTVSDAPEITTQPADAEVCQGGSHTFSVDAPGTSPLTFQWFKDSVSLPGETGQSLSLDPVLFADEGDYHVVVTNACGEDTSTTADLSVSERPTITTQPTDGDVCNGDTFVLAVDAEGASPITFQWFKDGSPLPGETGQTLTIPAASATDAGSYIVEATNTCGTTTSDGVSLIVSPCGEGFEPPGKSHTFVEPEACTSCEDEEGDLDPVYLFSGEYYLEKIDLVIPGRGQSFVWGRKYRSRRGPDTAQGVGWDFSYNLSVHRAGDDIVLDDGNSRSDRYRLQPDGSWAHEGFFRRVTEEPDGSHRVRFGSKGFWDFLPFDGSSAEGQVGAIEDRNGNRMEFEYDPQGRLVLVRDTLNREILIAYHVNGRVASVTDFAGRSVTYEYYGPGDPDGGEGDLASVTSPAVTGTPNGNDFPTGKTTFYTYSTGFADEALNHNLLSVTDPKGQTWLVNEYDTDPASFSYDHILRQTWGDAGDVIDVVYAEVTPVASNGQAVRKAIVNERVGNVKVLFFDAANQLVVRRDYTGRADPDLPTTDPTDPGGNPPVGPLRPGDPAFFQVLTEYNADSLPIRIVHPDGNEELLVYDDSNANQRSRGNLLSRTLLPGPRGSADQPGGRTESFEYDDLGGSGCCGTNFVTRHVDFRGNETLHDYDGSGNRIHTQHRIPSIVEDYEYNAFGQRTRHTLPDNDGHRRVDEWTYYGPGPQEGFLAESIVDATGFALTTTYEYDDVGNAVRVIDPAGNDTLRTYNALNQVVRTRSAPVETTLPGTSVRYETLTSYDANDNIVLVSLSNLDEEGAPYPNAFLDTVTTYETLNMPVRLQREVDPGQAVIEEYEYDANRNWTLHRKGEALNGNQPDNRVATEYDERDMPFRIGRAAGTGIASTDQLDYDGSGNTVAVSRGIESAPRVTTSTFDGYDRLVAVTDPMGNVTTMRYDANGNPISRRVDGELEDAPGGAANLRLAETINEYDAMDRGTRVRIQHFTPTTQTAIGDGESVTVTAWTDASLTRSITNDNGHGTDLTYDTVWRRASTVDAAGNRLEWIYDTSSNVVQMTSTERSDLGGPDEIFSTTHTYDTLNRRRSTTNNVGSTRSMGYDSRGNIVLAVDARGQRVHMDYDGLDRLLATRRELGGGTELTTSRRWDDSSRLVSRTDDNGRRTSYLYDALDRLIGVSFADATSRSASYDIHDNPVAEMDGNGNVTNRSFDLLNRPSATTHAPGSSVSSDTTFEMRAFDGLSRLVRAVDDDATVTLAFDSMDNVVTETSNGVATSSSHDGLGNRTGLTYPGGREIQATYDALERLREVTDVASPTGLIGRYDYVGPSRVTRRTHGNGTVMDVVYDGITGVTNPAGDFGERQIVGIRHHIPGGTVLLERASTWDRNGNRTTGTTTSPGQPADARRYAFDAVDRLTHVERGRSLDRPAGAGLGGVAMRQDRDYSLDGVGNRLSVASPPAGSLADDGDYVPNSMNEYVTTPFDTRTHDDNGNLTALDLGEATERTIVYDVHNRMVEHRSLATGEVTRYAYDALGRRIAKTRDATGAPSTTLFLHAGTRVIEERSGTGQILSTTVYGNYIDEPLAMRRGGVEHWYHPDDVHNVLAVSGPSGLILERYEYDDFGAVTIRDGAGTLLSASAVGNPYLFTGRRLDEETAWYHYRTRYFDPRTGRFTTRDTIGVWGDPGELGNAFTYVGNNPGRFVDPMGRTKCVPKLIKGKYSNKNVYWGSTWRKFLYVWASKSVSDTGFSMTVSGSAGAYYLLFYTIDDDTIKPSGKITCACIANGKCRITVAGVPGAVWQRTTGILSLAAAAKVTYRGDDEVDIDFEAGAANGGGGAVGAGVGPYSAGISFPVSGMAATVSLGSAKWRCVAKR